MKKCGVYEIVNKVNGKKYVGSSTNIRRRWMGHRAGLRHGKHCNPYLLNAWEKYGENSFAFKIIIIAEPNQIHHYEQILIDSGNYEYNISEDALSPMRGRHHTKKTIERLRKLSSGKNNYNYGRDFSKKTRDKMSKAKKGIPLRKEHKDKISNALKGREFTEEHRRKLSAAQTGMIYSEETKAKISKNHADVSGKNNPFYGKKHKEEAIQKNREAHMGKNNVFYGKHHTEQARNKISKELKGHAVSKETRKKISDGLKRYYRNKKTTD